MQYDITIVLTYSIILLCIGSFISVYIHRWPLFCEYHWKKEAHEIVGLPFEESQPPSFVSGRSQCPNCHTQLSILELIPIISFLIQLGKCRHCNQPIKTSYLITEMATLFICLPLLFFKMPLFELFLISFIFCCLLTITIFDYQHQWIPDELNGLLIILSLTLVLHNEEQVTSSVYGILFGYIGIYLIRFIFLNIRKIEVIGLGDAKLLAGIGAWFGVFSISYIVFFASIFGIVAFLFHRQRQSAFGPYLSLSAYLFFWYQIL